METYKQKYLKYKYLYNQLKGGMKLDIPSAAYVSTASDIEVPSTPPTPLTPVYNQDINQQITNCFLKIQRCVGGLRGLKKLCNELVIDTPGNFIVSLKNNGYLKCRDSDQSLHNFFSDHDAIYSSNADETVYFVSLNLMTKQSIKKDILEKIRDNVKKLYPNVRSYSDLIFHLNKLDDFEEEGGIVNYDKQQQIISEILFLEKYPKLENIFITQICLLKKLMNIREIIKILDTVNPTILCLQEADLDFDIKLREFIPQANVTNFVSQNLKNYFLTSYDNDNTAILQTLASGFSDNDSVFNTLPLGTRISIKSETDTDAGGFIVITNNKNLELSDPIPILQKNQFSYWGNSGESKLTRVCRGICTTISFQNSETKIIIANVHLDNKYGDEELGLLVSRDQLVFRCKDSKNLSTLFLDTIDINTKENDKIIANENLNKFLNQNHPVNQTPLFIDYVIGDFNLRHNISPYVNYSAYDLNYFTKIYYTIKKDNQGNTIINPVTNEADIEIKFRVVITPNLAKSLAEIINKSDKYFEIKKRIFSENNLLPLTNQEVSNRKIEAEHVNILVLKEEVSILKDNNLNVPKVKILNSNSSLYKKNLIDYIIRIEPESSFRPALANTSSASANSSTSGTWARGLANTTSASANSSTSGTWARGLANTTSASANSSTSVTWRREPANTTSGNIS